MGKKTNDLFYLVKSLSTSEYLILVDEMWKSSYVNLETGVVPKYVKLAKYLRTEKNYDDKAAKQFFGYDQFDTPVWRGFKRDTLLRVLKAMDRANGNESDRAKVQKAPEQIQQLIDKRIWHLADKIALKHIAIAVKTERFENLLQLLQLRSQIVVHSYPVGEVSKELDQIHAQRSEIRLQNDNVELLKDVLHDLRLKARLGGEEKTVEVRAILNSEVIAEKMVHSVRAEMFYWLIRRIASRIVRDSDQFIDALRKGIAFFGKHNIFWGNAEFRNFGVQSYSDMAVFSASTQKFNQAKIAIAKLGEVVKIATLSPMEVTELQARIFMCDMILARFMVNIKLMEDLAVKFMMWHVDKPSIISEELKLRVYHHAALNAFFIGSHSDCIKLTHQFRSSIPSVFRPKITSFMWVFYIIVRLTQKEYGAIKPELTAIKRYLQKFEQGNEVYFSLYLLGKSISSKNPVPVPEIEIKDTGTRILKLLSNSSYSYLETLFPFSVWSSLLTENHEMDNLLVKATKPMTVL